MDFPFYGSRSAYPQPYHRYYDQLPLNRKTTPSKGVLHIPVTDGTENERPSQGVLCIHVRDGTGAGTEQERPSQSNKPVGLEAASAAVKIQKVFRGFLVRKSVEKIDEIRNEVDEIENKILTKETMEELVKKNGREKLKINEMLMRLLLRLDSVRGVDSGVRDFRRAVIKKAIRLQETVDSITTASNNNDNTTNFIQSEDVTDQTKEDNVNEEEDEGWSEIRGDVNEEAKEDASGCAESMEMSSSCQGESQADSSENPRSNSIEGVGDLLENPVVNDGDVKDDEDQKPCGEENNKKEKEEEVAGESNKELLQRMMEDNKKMMGLMAQLFERNVMQTKLLNLLSQRVEELERALSCGSERSKKSKKKKRNSAGLADCLESTQDSKKSGKR